MPFGNRRGPLGLGPRTGRAAGHCSGNAAPGFTNAPTRRFLRRGAPGRGRSFGFRFRWRAGPSEAEGQSEPLALTAQREEQLGALKARADRFREALDEVQGRIDDLEPDGDDE